MTEQFFDTFDDFVRDFDEDSRRREAYRRQKPYYDLIVELVRLRKTQGITQEELARRANTHQSRISKIEAGEHDIRLSTLIDIAEALGASVDLKLVPVFEVSDKEWQTLVQLPAVTATETEETSGRGRTAEYVKATGIKVKA